MDIKRQRWRKAEAYSISAFYKKINFLWIFKRYKKVKIWSVTVRFNGVKLNNGQTASAKERSVKINRKILKGVCLVLLSEAEYIVYSLPSLIQSLHPPFTHQSISSLISLPVYFVLSVPVFIVIIFSLRRLFVAIDVRLPRNSVPISSQMSR